jgi:hypothetical protein
VPKEKVTLQEIESKIREITGSEDKGQSVAFSPRLAAVVGIFLVVVIAFMIGKKKGKVKSTIVEIKRL